jgi:DNA-binding LytR/AlgR family response regulator
MQPLIPSIFKLTPRTQLCLADVVYLESSRNYTFLVFLNGKRLLLSKTLGHLLEGLPSHQFVRISRTHVVNIQYLRRIQKNNEPPLALLKTNEQLPVSRRRLKKMVGFS